MPYLNPRHPALNRDTPPDPKEGLRSGTIFPDPSAHGTRVDGSSCRRGTHPPCLLSASPTHTT